MNGGPESLPESAVLIMSDARAPSVEQQPSFDIVCWQVIEEASSGGRFLIGHSHSTGRARMSSPVDSFEPSSSTVTTRSGRAYRLRGWSLPTAGHPLWQAYLRARGFNLNLLTDVSSEFLPTQH